MAPSAPAPTRGQALAAILKAEKTAALAKGQPFSWQEVGEVLDANLQPEPKLIRAKPTGSVFGDRRTIPPTPAQVTAYSASIGYPMDGEAWCDSYAQKGWKVGKNPMRDWQAAVRNWKSNRWLPSKAEQMATKPKGEHDLA